MYDNKKPSPLNRYPAPKKCPVCGHSSYSLDGTHPQCAVLQADRSRRLRLIAARKAKVAVVENDIERKEIDSVGQQFRSGG